ncbi:hypothetical protein JZU61_05440, partial [bacterium]|nr:hypothetical protein [bacterium]
ELVRYNDDKHIGFELISNKNRMTILGKGSNVDHAEGIGDNRDDFTYSIDPEVPYPLAGVTLLTVEEPYKIQIYISDFYRGCNGSASGTSRFVSGWEGDAPTWETLPIEKVQTHVSTAVGCLFESPEDMELAMKGELTELQQKLQGSFTPREDGGFFASGKVSHSYNKKDEIGMMYNGSLTMSWSVQCGDLPKDDSPQITLNGCTELSVGEQSEVTAKAADEGGNFSFWAEPEEMFTIENTGATAKLMGSSPGRGKLFVEYTSARGKTKQTSMVASCVSIESYNGGEAIPQIALFDIDGKKKSGILTVPVKGQPENATELVRFEPANPGVLSAEGAGSEVTLQGIKIGKTTLQAKTKCGVNTGPEVEVEVVNCDDETIARLEKMKKAAIENLVATTKDLQRHAGSKEFEKARDELVSSYVELLAKIGLTIITGGKTKGVVTKVEKGIDVVVSKAIPLAADIADYGSALSEIIGSSNIEELAGNVAKPASGEAFERIVELKFGETTKDLYGKSLSAVIGLVEVGFATDKFYDNVGKLVHHEDVLEKFKEMMEKAERDLEYIQSRQNICKRQKGESDESEIPLADLPPLRDKPGPPKKPTPPTKQADTPVPDPQNNETPAEQPTTDDEILVDPEFPPIPPRQVGLPYEPDDCGCNSSKNLTVTAKDLSTLGAGLKNLGECAKNFKSISVADYQNALTELSALTGSLSSVLETDAAAFLLKAKESKPQLDALVKRVKDYDEAGKAFLDKMEKCPESVSTGMDVLKSVEQITVDSIKTNY